METGSSEAYCTSISERWKILCNEICDWPDHAGAVDAGDIKRKHFEKRGSSRKITWGCKCWMTGAQPEWPFSNARVNWRQKSRELSACNVCRQLWRANTKWSLQKLEKWITSAVTAVQLILQDCGTGRGVKLHTTACASIKNPMLSIDWINQAINRRVLVISRAGLNLWVMTSSSLAENFASVRIHNNYCQPLLQVRSCPNSQVSFFSSFVFAEHFLPQTKTMSRKCKVRLWLQETLALIVNFAVLSKALYCKTR